MAGAITEHGDGLQLSSRRSARLNNYFLIVCHHDDLAAKSNPPAHAQDRLSCQLRPADRLTFVLLISSRSPLHEI
jgi:hypothetical protein